MMFEFIESRTTRELMDSGIAATKGWDGANPITVIDLAPS
jgi:methylmalonyl-CoA/ethylmalonyl-CoA epimerase